MLTSIPPTILTTVAFPPELQEQLEADFTVLKYWEQKGGADWLLEQGADVRAIVTSGAYGAPSALIEALPRLELVAVVGVGYDAIDLELARQRGIAVTTTPGVLDDCVADTALALLLGVMRRLVEADRFVRAGQWPQQRFGLGSRLAGKRCGIVGLGAIGRAIATRAAAFGMSVAYHGPRRKPEVGYPYYESIEELARDANVLVLALPGGPGTRHVIDRGVLTALGPSGVLINVARGSVVDQAALVELLLERRLGGAGLDVFEDEPNVPEALFELDNVVLTPHLASATHETRSAMGGLMLENLRAHFAGQPLPTPLQF